MLANTGMATLIAAGGLNWSSTATVTGTPDVGITRLGAGQLALGNGTASNTSGSLSLGTLTIGTPLPVTSGGTGSGTAAGALSSLGGVATVSNVNTYMGGGENPQSVAANAVTCDWSRGSTCVVATRNASTAWTLTMSNPVAGQTYRIRFVQNATGGASAAPLPTFSPTVRAWQGNQTPALTTTANKKRQSSPPISG